MSHNANKESSRTMKKAILWSMIGPFTQLATFFVALISDQPGLKPLLLSALLGLLLCLQFRKIGVWLSICTTLLVVFLTMPYELIDLKLGSIGFVIATLINTVIVHFSLKEVQYLLNRLLKQAMTYRDSYFLLKERLQEVQEEFENDRSEIYEKLALKQEEAMKLRSKIRAVERDLERNQERVQELKVSMAKEPQGSHAEKETQKLLDLLMHEKKELEANVILFSEKLKEQETLNAALNKDYETLVDNLVNQGHETVKLEEQLAELVEVVSQEKNKLMEVEKDKQELLLQKQDLVEQIIELQNKTEAIDKELASNQLAQMVQQPSVDEFFVKDLNLKFKHVDALYKQLKAQFDEKNKVLEETRRDLFTKENSLLSIQLKQDSKLKEEDIYIAKLEKDLAQMEDENIKLELENKNLETIVSRLIGVQE